MSPESSHEDHDALADRRADQGVWNGAMGQAELDGFYPDQSTKLPKAKTSELKTHKPSPTGKHKVEPGGGDVSRDEANFDALNNPMSPEKKAEVRRGLGHSSFLMEKERIAYNLMMERTKNDPQARAVELRKLADGIK